MWTRAAKALTIIGLGLIFLGAGGVYAGLWPLILGTAALGLGQLERRPRAWSSGLVFLGVALLLYGIETLGPGLRPLTNGELEVPRPLIGLFTWFVICFFVVLALKLIFLDSWRGKRQSKKTTYRIRS